MRGAMQGKRNDTAALVPDQKKALNEAMLYQKLNFAILQHQEELKLVCMCVCRPVSHREERKEAEADEDAAPRVTSSSWRSRAYAHPESTAVP